ncbi:MAG: nucleotide 5'-monophosphate nucleosidase PpnN [Gammaproteobacteria bacterium]|nr:nucleotide 5'-monophosphate nucleosidase PpnN [Gammaproteobacteria bacterium]
MNKDPDHRSPDQDRQDRCVETMDAMVTPTGALELLSQDEVSRLREADHGELNELFRRCALAVLNCGEETDNATEVFEQYPDFSIEIVRRTRGIRLDVRNAPVCAFVDGRMLNGVRDNLFAVLRDVVFMSSELYGNEQVDTESASGIRNLVFHILRNAGLLHLRTPPRLVVCWGGHSIERKEYVYSKDVGYQLGLRGMDICTGCGPGAMKSPMKGAAIGHAKQRIREGRYVGVTEPGIIAAESPNPIVNRLVVLPDIEKRLEAFVRMGHGIVVFPGGAGTLEEILFLLGVLKDDRNDAIEMPLIFTGPAGSESYFRRIDEFLVTTLGQEIRQHYQIIENDSVSVARQMTKSIASVARNRRKTGDAYYYNWLLRIPLEMKKPFAVSHKSMAAVELRRDLPATQLAINLRRVFSGIVAGNVKDDGIRLVREHGPFEISGDGEIMQAIDKLLKGFIEDGRMKLPGKTYYPCYTIAAN